MKQIIHVSESKSFSGGSVQLSSVQLISHFQLCNSRDCSTPGFPVHQQFPELTQTHVHRAGDAIQPSHPLSSPSPPAPNPSQHQGLFQWVSSLHEVAKVLEFQFQLGSGKTTASFRFWQIVSPTGRSSKDEQSALAHFKVVSFISYCMRFSWYSLWGPHEAPGSKSNKSVRVFRCLGPLGVFDPQACPLWASNNLSITVHIFLSWPWFPWRFLLMVFLPW